MSITATSVPSEQLFSRAGDIVLEIDTYAISVEWTSLHDDSQEWYLSMAFTHKAQCTMFSHTQATHNQVPCCEVS
jgi:hypothetical protein